MSINSTSLVKADPWGGYIFDRKFYASMPFGSRFELGSFTAGMNQMGEG